MKRSNKDLLALKHRIIACKACPRLVAWREKAAQNPPPRFKEAPYWGKPVPGFGDPRAKLFIVGLAPAAHGANRTGRMFTGDRSGDWLYHALHKAGFTNQPTSTSMKDGLVLHNCYITAAARCAPPANKPSLDEFKKCSPYLLREIELMTNVRVVLGLGKIAFDTAFDAMRQLKLTAFNKRPKFSHGAIAELNGSVTLVGSYHPSQQNTFTGKLTEKMFDGIFSDVREMLR